MSREWERQFERDCAKIRNGEALPGVSDLLCGAPFFRGHIAHDIAAWSRKMIMEIKAAETYRRGEHYDLIVCFLSQLERSAAAPVETLTTAVDVIDRRLETSEFDNYGEKLALENALLRLVLYRLCCPYPSPLVVGHALSIESRASAFAFDEMRPVETCETALHRQTLFGIGVGFRARVLDWVTVTPEQLVELGRNEAARCHRPLFPATEKTSRTPHSSGEIQ